MRVYWIDEIIQYIEEKVVDYLLENSVRRQINKVERKFITKKYQKDLEEMVLKKYGREPFYDQLCQVLFKNNTLERIMKKVYDRNLDENVIKEERLNLVCSKTSISAYNQSMVCDAVEYIMNQTVLIARNKNNCQKRRFVYVAFGVVMMVSMTQNFLQNRGGLQGNNEYEASPMFVVNSDNTEEKSRYNIRLENGIAAYVKMRGYEKYTFFHEGKEYDVRFVFLSKEKNGQVNMYDKGATLDYEVCNTGFNHDEAFKYMNKYVKEKFGNETVVSNTRYIDLNYYDYTNQNYTLRYSGTKNRIENYSVRKGELDTYPEHNCTVAFRENEDTFDQVRKLIDQVSNL